MRRIHRTLLAGSLVLVAAAVPAPIRVSASSTGDGARRAGAAVRPEEIAREFLASSAASPWRAAQSPSSSAWPLSAQISQTAGDPLPTVRTHRVTYRVSGQAASATIDYRTRGGPIEHRTTQSLPWTVSLDMPVGDPLHLTASGRAQWGEASIACEILVDGVVQARASGVGFPAVATCKARAAR